MSRMTRVLARRNRLLVATVWLVMLGSLVVTVAMERRFSAAGRSDLLPDGAGVAVVYVIALLAPACIGSRLALIHPRNPAGWLFLALALSLCWNGFVQDYAAWGTLYHPGSLPAAHAAATYADGGFLSWIVLLALIVLVTPTGSAPSPRWRIAGWAAATCGVVYYAFIPFRSTPHDTQPFVGMTGPFAGSALAPILTPVVFVALVGAHLALLAAVASFIVRIIHANRDERRQLRWLLIPAIPFPFMVAGAWAAARAENHTLLAALGLGYLVIIPVAAGLAIEKQRLYDVDRLVSRAVAYTLLSALVVVSYLAIVVGAGVVGGRAAAESVPAAVVATIVALSIGGFARRRLQDIIDRRFNRRAFTALELVHGYVREPDDARTIEDVLRDASGDPDLRVSYWVESAVSWVTESGVSAPAPAPAALPVPVREGGPGATIEFDSALAERQFIATLAAAARPELENARLRAAIQLQLVEVRESRARIVSAQLEERKRIERDLHDGSQQRLLALALNLRATELSRDSEAALRALPAAVDELQTTVRELRDLANGLYPSALENGGLAAALQQLAARAPIPVRLAVTEQRLPLPVESSAWFIACESVTNVVKHARATAVSLAAALEGGSLILSIDDDGVGGADSHGQGLRGIADRAEAAGGRLTIAERPTGGTSIRAVLPCEW